MKYGDIPSEELIHKLESEGRYPHPDLINVIWERRPETEPLLLVMFGEAFHDDWANDDDPQMILSAATTIYAI